MKKIIIALLLIGITPAYATTVLNWPQKTTIQVCQMMGTPVNPTDPCNVNNCSYDSNYFYVCIASNTWERTALTTWSVSNQFLLLENSGFLLLEDGTKLIL